MPCVKATHYIIVKSVMNSNPNSKCFRICAPAETVDSLTELLIAFKEQEFQRLFSSDIIFTDEIRLRRSHEITVLTVDKHQSQTFSIKAPHYGSEEIAEVLRAYLYGEDYSKKLNLEVKNERI